WFLASTDFGLHSQWLDMTSYDHDENFGVYLAVLKKSDSSPLLPESDEDRGVGTGRRSLPPGVCAGDVPTTAADPTAAAESQAQTPRGPRQPVTVQIDFDGLRQRIISVPGVPERQYSELHSGADGIVFYLEAPARGQGGSGAGGGAGSELIRYRLCDRRAATFVNGVTAYEVSADGRKLVYRSAGGGGGAGRGAGAAAGPPPSLFIVDADRTPPQPGAGRLNVNLRMYLDPK